MPPSDLLSALLNLVPAAAHEDSTQALDPRGYPATRLTPPLVNTRATAHSRGGPTNTFDRVCRKGRILYVRVGDVRRFDVRTARLARGPSGPCPGDARCPDATAKASGVRRVSHEGRHRRTGRRQGRVRSRSWLEPRRSIGPSSVNAHASCWLPRSARHEERMRELAGRASEIGGDVTREGVE
jgi:hypothetical protein